MYLVAADLRQRENYSMEGMEHRYLLATVLQHPTLTPLLHTSPDNLHLIFSGMGLSVILLEVTMLSFWKSNLTISIWSQGMSLMSHPNPPSAPLDVKQEAVSHLIYYVNNTPLTCHDTLMGSLSGISGICSLWSWQVWSCHECNSQRHPSQASLISDTLMQIIWLDLVT